MYKRNRKRTDTIINTIKVTFDYINTKAWVTLSPCIYQIKLKFPNTQAFRVVTPQSKAEISGREHDCTQLEDTIMNINENI